MSQVIELCFQRCVSPRADWGAIEVLDVGVEPPNLSLQFSHRRRLWIRICGYGFGCPIHSQSRDTLLAKFLNTSATNYFLEELIKGASERLVLISPYLKLNDRIKELLEDKNRLKMDVRIVYGKNELQPEEINWLRELNFIRTSFCKNLHAKCYLNEKTCIIGSLNLYEFSQVNNNEMGVALDRTIDSDVYNEAYEEAQRIIRVSDEVRMSLDKVEKNGAVTAAGENVANNNEGEKISSSKLGKKNGLSTQQLLAKLTERGLLVHEADQYSLTAVGTQAGGELVRHKRFGDYFVWPAELVV